MELPTDARQIPFATDYFVTRDGRVFSRKNGRVRAMKPLDGGGGHVRVNLWMSGVCRSELIHRLVVFVFHGPQPSAAHEVRHLDGNPAHNDADNLAWGTRAENIADRLLHGGGTVGEQHGMARLSGKQVIEIRQRCATGETQRRVARDFGVAASTVSMIAQRRIWKHLEDSKGVV